MHRVYIDSNIFRYLRKRETPFYSVLFQNLIKYSDRLIYYFSHAHMLDLERDKTDLKYDDLEFMETFVKSNYLFQSHGGKFVNVQIATPKEAFNGLGEVRPFVEYFNLEEIFEDELFKDSPEIMKSKDQFEKLLNTPIKLNLASNLDKQSEEIRAMWGKLIPEIKDEYTFLDWIEQFSAMYQNLYEDKNTYKKLRLFSIETLNLVDKYDIDIESFDFDQDLKDTPLQQSFFDLVEKTMSYYEDNEDQKEFNFFIIAFNLLNILGIDKEPNKKARFANTLNDGQHAYYAAHCEYLISDDEGLLLKAKVLYKLLGIETKVIPVEEFSKSIGVIAGNIDTSINSYLDFLNHELKTALIIDTKFSFKYNRQYVIHKTKNFHFGYFNRFDFVRDEENGEYYIFYQKMNNYSKFISYQEIESVTNRIVKVFGADDFFRGKYSFKDREEIQNGNWNGRVWTIDKFKFILEINEGSKEFCFVLSIN